MSQIRTCSRSCTLHTTRASNLELEGHRLDNIYRRGWRVGLVKPGGAITVTIAPRKDGADDGYVVGIKTADGPES